MVDTSHENGGPSSARVTGAASRAIVRLLSDRGLPANELVVTNAQRLNNGEGSFWVVTVLRGREQRSHEFAPELIDKVLARGPCDEWYSEVFHMLEAAGVAFPA